MKRIYLVIIIAMLSFLSACVENEETSIPVETKISELSGDALNSTYISWHGRYHMKDDQAFFYHTATGFEVSIYGRVIQIELSLEDYTESIYYTIVKDDEDILDAEVIMQSEEEEVLTVTFDDYGYHTLKMLKRSEPEDGITSLVRLSTNGEFLEVDDTQDSPHFLILGASGISGHGALGEANEPRTTENSSPFHSFGYLTARHFLGTFEFVSSSGWGLKYGYNDRLGEENIAKAYDYVGITPDRKIVYEDSLYQKTPDYVIINLGGNDYTAVINRASGFDKTEKIQAFKDAVALFILKLRSDAPNAHIIWTMTEGSLNGTAAMQVINQLDPSDQAFVHMVIIKQVGEDGDPVGANNHASFITHQKSAENIIDLIESLNTSS